MISYKEVTLSDDEALEFYEKFKHVMTDRGSFIIKYKDNLFLSAESREFIKLIRKAYKLK